MQPYSTQKSLEILIKNSISQTNFTSWKSSIIQFCELLDTAVIFLVHVLMACFPAYYPKHPITLTSGSDSVSSLCEDLSKVFLYYLI